MGEPTELPEPTPEQRHLAQRLADQQRQARQDLAIPPHILNAPPEHTTYHEMGMVYGWPEAPRRRL